MAPDTPSSRPRLALYLVFTINVVVFVGITAARIVFSLYGLTLGATSAGVGAITAMLYIFPLLLSWPIGKLVDRFGGRWLLVGGSVCGAGAMLIPYFNPSLASLYMAAGILGLTLAFTSVVGQFLVGELSAPAERTKNFSNYALSGAVCVFLGPLLAGFSIDHFGHRQTCLGVTLLLLLSVTLLVALGGSLPGRRAARQAGGNLLNTLKDRTLWKILAISSAAQLGNDLFQTFLPIHAHGIGLSASIIGSVFSAFAVGSFSVRFVMVRLIAAVGERRLLVAAFYFTGAVFLLLPFANAAVPLAALAFLFGCSLGCAQPLTMMLMYSNAQEGRAGEAVGLRFTANNIARIVGPVLFGAVGAVAGLLTVFWINGALMACAGRLGSSFASKIVYDGTTRVSPPA